MAISVHFVDGCCMLRLVTTIYTVESAEWGNINYGAKWKSLNTLREQSVVYPILKDMW